MRGFFEFLSIFDWITPSVGFIQDIINDPTPLQSNSWTFFVPYEQSLGGGWNAVDIEKLMKQHGIHYWGSQFTNGEFFFSVKRDQAQWAEYILLKNNVPLNEEFIGAPRPRPKSEFFSNRKPSRAENDFLTTLGDYIDDLLS